MNINNCHPDLHVVCYMSLIRGQIDRKISVIQANIIHSDELDCVTCLFRKKNNITAVNVLIEEHRIAQLDSTRMNDGLVKGEYGPALLRIWSEPDNRISLAWLESQANKLHAPLLLELAIVHFFAVPTIDHLISVVIPTLRAGLFRATQDHACLSVRPEGKQIQDCLQSLYEHRLEGMMLALLDCSLKNFYDNYIDQLRVACRAKLVETARASLGIDLPDPKWVAHYGNANVPPVHLMMGPTLQIRERKRIALKLIERLEPVVNLASSKREREGTSSPSSKQPKTGNS